MITIDKQDLVVFAIFAAVTAIAAFFYIFSRIGNNQRLLRILKPIEAKGYAWAKRPWNISPHVFIAAYDKQVKRVGYLADGKSVYETDDGECFYCHQNINHAVIDVAGRIHISNTWGLALQEPGLIIPPDWYVIFDKSEVNDYLIFHRAQLEWNGDNDNNPYEWDTEIVSERK